MPPTGENTSWKKILINNVLLLQKYIYSFIIFYVCPRVFSWERNQRGVPVQGSSPCAALRWTGASPRFGTPNSRRDPREEHTLAPCSEFSLTASALRPQLTLAQPTLIRSPLTGPEPGRRRAPPRRKRPVHRGL